MTTSPAPEPRDRWGPLRFDHADRRALQVAVVLGVVVATVWAVVAPVVRWVAGYPLPLLVEQPDVGVPGLPTEHLGTLGPTEVTVGVRDPSVTDRLLGMLPGLLVLGVVVLVARLLLGLVRDLSAGDPFRPVHGRRMRVVALALGAGALVHSLVSSVVSGMIAASRWPVGETFVFVWSIPVGWLVAMLVVACVAECFVIGARLRDESDGLV